MTPKEEAQKIYKEFENIIHSNAGSNNYNFKDAAKECSLFSVNMILQPFLIDYQIRGHWIEV